MRTRCGSNLGLAAIAVAALLLFASGCGDDGDDGAASTSAGSTSGETSTALAEFEKEVEAAVAEASSEDSAEPPTSGPKAVPDKSIYIIACTMAAEGCVRPAAGMEAAAKDLGWEATVIDTQSAPDQAAAAFRKAIAAKADGIAINGFDATTLAGPIKLAQEAGLKVSATLVEDPDGQYDSAIPPLKTLFEDGYTMGQMLYKLTDGKPHFVMFTGDEFAVVRERRLGTEKFVEDCKAAGGDCEILAQQPILSAELATGVPGLAVSVMRSHPDANAIWSGYDAAIPFLTQGLQQAGLTEKGFIVGFDGNKSSIEVVHEGGFQKASMALPMEWMGYQSVDNLNRLFAGDEPVPLPPRVKLITQENAPADGSYTGDYPDYEAVYKRNWGK